MKPKCVILTWLTLTGTPIPNPGGCDSEALDDLSLVKLLEPAPYASLQAARLRLTEAQASREARSQSRREVEAQMAQMERMGVELFR